MSFMPVLARTPTPRERRYLEALAAGQRRPPISGQAGNMCRRFGWCETLYRAPDGTEVRRSAIPLADPIAVVKAGYRAIGYVLTERGQAMLRLEP
jgi:hypothetical protein